MTEQAQGYDLVTAQAVIEQDRAARVAEFTQIVNEAAARLRVKLRAPVILGAQVYDAPIEVIPL